MSWLDKRLECTATELLAWFLIPLPAAQHTEALRSKVPVPTPAVTVYHCSAERGPPIEPFLTLGQSEWAVFSYKYLGMGNRDAKILEDMGGKGVAQRRCFAGRAVLEVITCLGFNCTDTCLAASTRMGQLIVLDTRKWTILWKLQHTFITIISFAWSGDRITYATPAGVALFLPGDTPRQLSTPQRGRVTLFGVLMERRLCAPAHRATHLFFFLVVDWGACTHLRVTLRM